MAVGELDGLIEGVEDAHADERAEGLRLVESIAGADAVDDRGMGEPACVRVTDETASRVMRRDASHAGGAVDRLVILDECQVLVVVVEVLLVDHRAVQHRLHRIANDRVLHRVDEALAHSVVHVALHPQGAQRRAALARRTEPGEERTLDDEVEVGVRHHHHGVLAAKFEARRLQVATREFAELAPYLRRPREADLVDESLLQRGLETVVGRGTVGEDHLKHVARHSAGVEDLRHCLRDCCSLLCRLPHDRVARHERRNDVPGGHGRREIPRGDDHCRAHGHPEREELLIGHLTRHRLAVEPPPLAEEEVARVDDFLHVPERLGVHLAHFTRDQLGQRFLVGLEEASNLGDDTSARGGWDRGPGGLRILGRPAGRHDVGAGRERVLQHDIVETCWIPGGVRRHAPILPPAPLEATPSPARSPRWL